MHLHGQLRDLPPPIPMTYIHKLFLALCIVTSTMTNQHFAVDTLHLSDDGRVRREACDRVARNGVLGGPPPQSAHRAHLHDGARPCTRQVRVPARHPGVRRYPQFTQTSIGVIAHVCAIKDESGSERKWNNNIRELSDDMVRTPALVA